MVAAADLLGLSKVVRRLGGRPNWLGRLLRRGAIRWLIARKEAPTVVAALLEAHASASSLEEASRIETALRSLESAPARDAVCEAALRAPGSIAEFVARAGAWAPLDPGRAALFLFLTGQIDRYLEIDPDFRELRLEYDSERPEVRARVLDVVRAGDRRLIGFLGSRRRLPDLEPRELRAALQSLRRHGDWARLFQAFLELPLKHGIPILRELRSAGFEPPEADERSLLRAALELARGHFFPTSPEQDSGSRLFDEALAGSLEDDMLREAPVEALLERMGEASPLEGVAIVGLLARRRLGSARVSEALSRSPHWLVRLAARRTRLVLDILSDTVEDPCVWVRERSPAVPPLELWPGEATPAHLETLRKASQASRRGALGAARAILGLLLAHRVTCGTFEEMVVEAEDLAGSFEPVEMGDLKEFAAEVGFREAEPPRADGAPARGPEP